jgi:hypothetical protein
MLLPAAANYALVFIYLFTIHSLPLRLSVVSSTLECPFDDTANDLSLEYFTEEFTDSMCEMMSWMMSAPEGSANLSGSIGADGSMLTGSGGGGQNDDEGDEEDEKVGPWTLLERQNRQRRAAGNGDVDFENPIDPNGEAPSNLCVTMLTCCGSAAMMPAIAWATGLCV